MTPKRKQSLEQYQAEYKKLQVELRLALGEPMKNEEGLHVWGDAKTNTLFTLIFNGKLWALKLEQWRESHE